MSRIHADLGHAKSVRNNVEQASGVFKKKLQGEGGYREMKLGRHFEKPSENGTRTCRIREPSAQSRPQAGEKDQ